MIRSNAIQILDEQRLNWDEPVSLKEYHEHSKNNDPTYLRWLFNDDDLGDYGLGMTKKQKEALKEFEKRIN